MSAGEIDYRLETAGADEELILHNFLEAKDAFVSGSDLAAQLNVSRPAIKGKLEKLRSRGFEFEAVRNRGYRLTQTPEVLDPALLRCELKRLECKIETLYFPVIDSTNSEAERQHSRGRTGPFAVLSSCQTKGRGRLGRDWHSVSADNLYLSVCFSPKIPPQQLQHFTLWAGIHICRQLQTVVSSAALEVKWPNDLLCGGRKFAGMLTEARVDADRIQTIIFGIGLNVNSNPNDFPPVLRNIVTSLRAVQGEHFPINLVAAQVIQAINTSYHNCIHNPPTESLIDAWPAQDALQGKSVTAIVNGQEITGTACGIDESGALLLRSENNKVTAIRSGDVSLKK